jgi:hypothetical protein
MEVMPMSDNGQKELTDLAEEYLESLDSNPGETLEELCEELKYWKDQVGEFEEGTPMHDMAVEERNKAQEQLDAIEAKGERCDELRNELLTRVSKDFAPQGEWLESTVIEALSHTLTGHRRGRLLVGEHTLPDDADELSRRKMVPVAKTVHALAEDAIENDERIAELWDKLDTDTQCSILGVLARYEEPISSGKISDELGEDRTDSPGANIRYLRGEVEIDPYRSTDKGYALTLAGRYVWKEYGPDTRESADNGDGQEAGTEEVAADGEEETTAAEESAESVGDVDLSSFEIQD